MGLGELVTWDALIPAERAAHLLHSYADNLREQALALGSFEGFHQLLYGALLHYRSAQLVYDSLLAFYRSPENYSLTPRVDLEELERESIVCEEMRTVIAVSFLYTIADVPNAPNFSQVDQFGTWLSKVLSYEYEAAEEHIHDLYSKLLYPRFMRDTALGWILLMHGTVLKNDAAFDKGVRHFLQVAELLESNLRGSLIPLEEPIRLIPLYQTLANALRAFGRPTDARIYERKATPEYIRSLHF